MFSIFYSIYNFFKYQLRYKDYKSYKKELNLYEILLDSKEKFNTLLIFVST